MVYLLIGIVCISLIKKFRVLIFLLLQMTETLGICRYIFQGTILLSPWYRFFHSKICYWCRYVCKGKNYVFLVILKSSKSKKKQSWDRFLSVSFKAFSTSLLTNDLTTFIRLFLCSSLYSLLYPHVFIFHHGEFFFFSIFVSPWSEMFLFSLN